MTTAPDRHEPLDPEERDLAARLGRVGPFEGPSPALDARILAAAHKAAAARTPRRQHRLTWLGLPPALITGVGVAAAAVLALGLVWQLRPQYGGVITRQEAEPGDETIIMVEPPAAATPSAGPSAPEAPAPTDSALRKQRTTSADMAAARPVAKMSAPAPPTAPIAEAGTPAADAEPEEKRVADAVAEDAASASGFVAEPPGSASSPPTRKSHATYTTAARATAERRERAAANVAPAAAPQAASQPASQAESTVLDRIEVTGSRVTAADIDWSRVPVSDDAGLAPAEWLERIRARRDADDADHARASLERFKREHPRVRVPDDLRALLVADAPR